MMASENSQQLISAEQLKNIKETLAIAESLALASMMTSPSAKRRLQARQLEMDMKDENNSGYVPPKHLLLYLVRMGSFSSAQRIENEDTQDRDVILPNLITVEELLNHCITNLRDTPSILRRSFLTLSDAPLDDRKFRILQWNVLSQSLGVHNDRFVRCPMEALDWNRRRFLMLHEIVSYSPDIICLQEVDHFDFLRRGLSPLGYSGTFYPKPDSPCIYLKDNNGPDGCAIFYSNRFELITVYTRILEVWKIESNQVAILALLRDRCTGLEVCIVTTHLKARKGALLSSLRNEQGKDLLEFIRSHRGNRPVIICGDFNAEPSEPVYHTITNNRHFDLSSACNLDGDEPPYTTWKIRDEGEIRHTIDYVFYSNDFFNVCGFLQFPSEEEIGENRVPSMEYPSDHFSLVCDLSICGEFD